MGTGCRVSGTWCASASLNVKKIFSVLGLLILWTGCSLRPALGQAVYGSIIGTVTDPSGGAVVNATITVIDVAKGTSVATTTNGNGEYTVQHLIPDTYSVQVEAAGFKKATVDNVIVYADTVPKIDVQMTVGAVSAGVTVTAAAPLLQTENTDVNTVLNARALEDLPNLNRNFTAFELLTPGTSYIGWNVSEAENPQRSQQIEVNGQLPFATGYELDGTDNQDPVIGIAVINPNLDAVSEMKVTSQNYDAEFGTAVAGLVTAQTKSGSNSFHGSGFEFYRNSAQQARDPFTQFAPNPLTGDIIPSFLHHQFGGSVGGPILKDKLFFFGDYQGERETTGQSFLLTVPTLSAKNSCTATTGTCDLSQYLQGGLGQAYDPTTGNPTTGAGRTPFPNNQIPAGQLSTPAVNLLKLLPAPNNGTGIINNYIASGSGTFNNDQFDVRIDDQITEKTHIFGRYTFFRSLLSGAPALGEAGGPGFGSNGFAGSDTGRNQSLAVGGDRVVSPQWLTDFRFGWFRYHINENGPDFNQPKGTELGIGGVNQGDLTLNGGLPQFNIDGMGGAYGTTAAQFLESENQIQFVNNWSHQVGSHDIKFGADFRYDFQHLIGLDNNNVRTGNFHFAASNTSEPTIPTNAGLGLATFVLGNVTAFQRTQTQNTNAQERQKRFFYYAQDHWRITNRFTLSYGLRYEWYFPESVNGKGQGGLLDINTGNIRIAGFGPYGTNLNVEKSWTNLAPRLGISWQARKNTVVRAGLGRVYGIGWSGDFFGEVLTFSYPTQVSQNLNAATNFSSLFGLAPGPPAYVFAPIPADGNYPLPNGVSVPLRPLRVRIPTLDAWNLTVQQEITPTVAVQVAYVGSHGIHNMFDSSNQFDPNEATIAGFGQTNPATGLPYTTNDRRPYFDGIAQQLGVTFGHPFGWTQSLRYNINEATSNYNALQVRAEKRFSHGVQFLAHYTWSRAMQHESDYFAIDPKVGYGASYYNRPQVFLLTGNWDLPFGHGQAFVNSKPKWMDEIIGGWSLNGTLTIEKGLPYTPTYASCSADIDTGPCRPSGTGAPYHLAVGPFDPVNHTVTYFQPSPTVLANGQSFGPYLRPASGTFGDIFRDSLNGPALINTDLSAAKSFSIKENLRVQFRTDFFNLFNHPNLGEPNNCVDCQNGQAGKITDVISTQDGSSMRRIQFAVRITF